MDDVVMRTSYVTLAHVLPVVNACFNATSAVLLLLGLIAVRRGKKVRHMNLMLAALTTSTLFLVGYLTRMALTGTHRIGIEGVVKWAYLTLLFSHMVLAVALLPLLGRVLFLAWHKRFAEHRRLALWAWPIWMYVSVTGVIVYAVLYHVAPALEAQLLGQGQTLG